MEIALCKWLDEQCLEQPLPPCLIKAEKKSRWGKPARSYGARAEAPKQTSRFIRNPRNSEAKRATFAQKWTLTVSTCLLLCGLNVFFNSGVLPYSLK